MAHTPIQELTQKQIQAQEAVTPGDLFYHYKKPDTHYKVLYIAIQEATEKPCVIYQSLHDKIIWVRDLDSWQELINSHGTHVTRFLPVKK